jgi:hypothetical protein
MTLRDYIGEEHFRFAESQERNKKPLPDGN